LNMQKLSMMYFYYRKLDDKFFFGLHRCRVIEIREVDSLLKTTQVINRYLLQLAFISSGYSLFLHKRFLNLQKVFLILKMPIHRVCPE